MAAPVSKSSNGHSSIKYSIVVPVYNNELALPDLLARLSALAPHLPGLEVVFVVDGSPDQSQAVLKERLPRQLFESRVVELSRNFGSFAAIRTGIGESRGEYVAVMAADMQEPPELAQEFFAILETGAVDVTIGKRQSQASLDKGRLQASLFWRFYRKFVFPEMPEGGVDIFACNRKVANEIVALNESNSSLVGLLYWVGFRRAEVAYGRLDRQYGVSGWTLSKKTQYMLDSIFSFTSLPLTVLIAIGAVGGTFTVVAAIVVLASFLAGAIREPGYTPLMLVILLSTFSLLLALGIVGSYVWRAFENTKGRPNAIVMSRWGSSGFR